MILIIGILAAIAIPAFLTQRSKGQDAAAKSDARNMVSQMEACFTEDDKYVGCTAALNINNTNLDIGPGIGQVRIVSESADRLRDRGDLAGAVRRRQPPLPADPHARGGRRQATATSHGKGGCPPDRALVARPSGRDPIFVR